MRIYPDFETAITSMVKRLLASGTSICPNNWQSMSVRGKKEAETIEVLNESFQVPVSHRDLKSLQADIKPNLPWADDHFELERISGMPINPGETWKRWPWGLSADKFRTDGEAFSHSYAERYWPRFANCTPGGILSGNEKNPRLGIRYPYGDLNNIVERMVQDPLTRQAVLSVWHPEDQYDGNQRVPCSLFYHFIQRHGVLHMTYCIRSCDALRHLPDDIYLSVRLMMWVLDNLKLKDAQYWGRVYLGLFTMHITSLHCFVGDRDPLKKRIGL